LHADIVPGRWDKLESQPSGTQIVIWLKSGERLEVTSKNSTDNDVTVVPFGGGELRTAKPDVQKVESEKYQDSNKEGTLIGLGGGFAFDLPP
jgi:hypothetical protein